MVSRTEDSELKPWLVPLSTSKFMSETTFKIYHGLPIAMQRRDAVSVMGTFVPGMERGG